ncbi:histone deacetylase family protein [Pseudomonadota bacterium]|jgi:acetoin utilization deacetylase AcuC-like enzyme
MKTLILHHDDCLKHDPGSRHAESPARITAVMNGIRNISGTEMLPAPRASVEQLERAHAPDYWKRLLELEPGKKDPQARIALDADTFLSAGSIDATLRGSGAACFAVDQVFAGKARNAFCATRPPGHHADSATAMGFCLLNQAAVAARHAQNTHGAGRIAILDFDVHHGNGTQAIFEDSPDVLYISSHQMPLYPGTGYPEETGRGNILNLPLPPGSGSTEFRRIWSDHGLKALEKFSPDLVIISAGFDAHLADPLAQLELVDDDYGWITSEICSYAAANCGSRVISVLEGGYDLDALSSASAAHVTALAG